MADQSEKSEQTDSGLINLLTRLQEKVEQKEEELADIRQRIQKKRVQLNKLDALEELAG